MNYTQTCLYEPCHIFWYTLQSLYKTPCYNTDLDITWSCCGYHGILQSDGHFPIIPL